jgi:hypothetical protein
MTGLWLKVLRHDDAGYGIHVASDLRRVSHRDSGIYSDFAPDAGAFQDLLCERGAQSECAGRRGDMLPAELPPPVVRYVVV